jgi:DNA polymerase-3 subunit alpha
VYGSEKEDKKRIKEGETPFNIKGCVANGISEEAAITIWNKMSKFAEYAFNKSHKS